MISKTTNKKSTIKLPKVFNITYPNPEYTVLGTPEAIPTTEPGTSQAIYTAQNSNRATGYVAFEEIYCSSLQIAGTNITGSSITLYSRGIKNSTSVTTSSNTINANENFNISCNLFNISLNDVLELRLWASTTGLEFKSKIFFACPTRPRLTEDNQLLLNISYDLIKYPDISGATGVYADTYTFADLNSSWVTYDDLDIDLDYGASLSSQVNMWRIKIGDSYGNIRLKTTTDSVTQPYYMYHTMPEKVSFKPTTIIV